MNYIISFFFIKIEKPTKKNQQNKQTKIQSQPLSLNHNIIQKAATTTTEEH